MPIRIGGQLFDSGSPSLVKSFPRVEKRCARSGRRRRGRFRCVGGGDGEGGELSRCRDLMGGGGSGEGSRRRGRG